MGIYHVSSITWAESNSEELINHNALPTSEYVEVPDDLNEEELQKFIEHTLFESTSVQPWYFNLDKIEIIP
jgi:hypothetical protein